jgi:hypothetical protein
MADNTIELVQKENDVVHIYDPTMGMKYSASASNPFTKAEATEATINSIAVLEGMSQIQLLWTQSDEADHDYTEIYRSETDDPNTALLVGTSKATAYNDSVDAGVTYYYWLRPVSYNGEYGALSDGVTATSGNNPSRFAQALGTALTDDNLSPSMISAIEDLIADATDSTLLSLQASIETLNVDLAGLSNLASLVTSINTLRAELEAEDVAIRAEMTEKFTALATNETAFLNQIESLETALSNEERSRIAAIEQEQTLRANALAVTAENITSVSADLVTEAQERAAAIEAEALARTTDIASVSSDITALTASLSTTAQELNSAISSEAQLRVSEDTSLASLINSLSSTLDNAISDVQAAISTESATRVSTVNALAQTVSNYTTTLNGNTSSISTLTASVDGLQAEYAVKTDVNGRVAGIGLMNDGTTSTFAIEADNFEVYDPDSADLVFGTSNGVTMIDGAYIKDASIGSASIESLDAAKISADTLSAIRADMGTITAGYMANNTGRFVIDLNNNSLKVFDASGVLRVQLGDLG